MTSMTSSWHGLARQIKSAGEQDQQHRNQQYRQPPQHHDEDADDSDYKRIDEYA